MVGMWWARDTLLFSCGLKPRYNSLISANYIRYPSQPAPIINHIEITSLIRYDEFKNNINLGFITVAILSFTDFTLAAVKSMVSHPLFSAFCFLFLIFISVTSGLFLFYIALSPEMLYSAAIHAICRYITPHEWPTKCTTLLCSMKDFWYFNPQCKHSSNEVYAGYKKSTHLC